MDRDTYRAIWIEGLLLAFQEKGELDQVAQKLRAYLRSEFAEEPDQVVEDTLQSVFLALRWMMKNRDSLERFMVCGEEEALVHGAVFFALYDVMGNLPAQLHPTVWELSPDIIVRQTDAHLAAIQPDDA